MESPMPSDGEKPLLVATKDNLESLHENVQYLWCSSDIPVYENPPSALEFLRNHVAISRPCIIRNSILEPNDASDPDGKDSATPLTMTLDDLVRLFPKEKSKHDQDSSPPSSSLPPLCVDVTPDGHGDCLRKVAHRNEEGSTSEEKIFVKPLETEMSLPDFCRRLRKGRTKQQQMQQEQCQEEIIDKIFESTPSNFSEETESTFQRKEDDDTFFEDCVLYYSRQNDCLREELTSLWNLKRSLDGTIGIESNTISGGTFVFPRSFTWAEEAFFGEHRSVGPDAVNLWMGDERAVSAMHKDHYENLFYVLSGEKVFSLCPPSDAPCLYENEVSSGRFEVCNETSTHGPNRTWKVALDREDNGVPSKVHWIETNLFEGPRNNEGEKFPLVRYAHPMTVRVRAGELLYLPSLWFHRVTQTCETVGINYWYDMNFESPLWCYFHFLQQLQPRE